MFSSIDIEKNCRSSKQSFWLYFTLSKISLIRRVVVLAEKLTSENNFIFSEHTVSTTAIIHFFTKSPSVNGLLSFAIDCATLVASKSNIFQLNGLPLKYRNLLF